MEDITQFGNGVDGKPELRCEFCNEEIGVCESDMCGAPLEDGDEIYHWEGKHFCAKCGKALSKEVFGMEQTKVVKGIG